MDGNINVIQWCFVTLGTLIFTGFFIYSIVSENEIILLIGMVTYLLFIIFFMLVTSEMGKKRHEKKI